jgi:hypothetical protein
MFLARGFMGGGLSGILSTKKYYDTSKIHIYNKKSKDRLLLKQPTLYKKISDSAFKS